MKKIIITKLACLSLLLNIQAQKKSTADKVVEASEKANKKSQQISDASNKVAGQAREAGDNAKNIAGNVKAVIKVFEPIFKLHFKKKNKNKPVKGDEVTVIKNTPVKSDNTNNNYESVPQPIPGNSENGNNTTGTVPALPQANYDPGIPESKEYNSDGTANWGNQYNAEFGCYLDALTGTIMDGGQSEDNPNAVDLIFLAPNDGQNAYYLITPNFAHDNITADAYWGSATTDNPVKTWKSVNESEVAVTNLTGIQFEKIQYNEQLRGAVKNAKGFSSFYISLNKLDGKVFAVKTTMGERDAFALIYIVKHIGTSGSGGYLKVKIKCTGFDNNNDGNPDAGLYETKRN